MPQGAQNTIDDIEYVYIEMVLKQEAKYEVIPGRLQGVKKKDDTIFILLSGKEDVTNLISLKYYNIMTIEVLYKYSKDMTHLTTSENDQKVALVMVKNLYEGLLEKHACEGKDTDLIDVTTYVNVPTDYYEGTSKKLSKSVQDKSVNVQYNSGIGDFANKANSNVYSYATTTKKKHEPYLFDRAESKKPSKSVLVLMQEKIDQINTGKFECEIPETPEEPEENQDHSSVINLYEENQHWA